jgi:hypothetical protein
MERHMLPLYRTVMDSNVNPLRATPPAQRFQIMVYLSVMWTAIFCAAAGIWFWYGPILAVHLLFATGFLITGLTFHAADKPALIARRAERRGAISNRAR